jgi:hypothetical protein
METRKGLRNMEVFRAKKQKRKDAMTQERLTIKARRERRNKEMLFKLQWEI